MAYDEQLAERVEKALKKKGRVVPKKMMGGITYMLNGKMCVGVRGVKCAIRLGPAFPADAKAKVQH